MFHTLRCIRGDSVSFPLTLTDPPSSSTPFDPTGWTLLATFKWFSEDPDTGSVIQKLSTVGGFAVTDATAGEVTLSLVPADFVHVDPGVRYVMDVQAQNESTGAVKTVAFGDLVTTADVTKKLELSVPTTVVDPSAAYLSAAALAEKADEAAASAAAAAVSAADADDAADAAEAAADRAEAALGGGMVLVSQDETTATFNVASFLVVSEDAATVTLNI